MNAALLGLVLSSAVAGAGERKWAALAVPLVAYDSNFGLGLGAAGQVAVADPSGQRPYRLNVDGQFYKSTGGFDDHFLGLDLPGAFGSTLRWDLRVRYQRWDRAPYYGLGNHSPRDEEASEEWYRWQIERPFALTHLRVPVATDLEVYLGLSTAWVGVTTLPDSLLLLEQPRGVDGGWVSSATVGLFHDSRTDEVDPRDGMAVDLALRASLPAPLSDYAFAGGHGSVRGWRQLGERWVFAGHALLDGNAGGLPFFDAPLFGGLQRTGIGGRYLLRGLAEERLRGDGVLATQGEARLRLGQTTLFKRLDVGWTVAGFSDVGWALTWAAGPPQGREPQVTAGTGLRWVLNELLVVRVDAGVAVERWVQSPTRRLQPQIYMLAAQPF